MRIFRGYLMRRILFMTALVMSVLCGLAMFLQFVSQLDDVGSGDFGMPQALLYALLKLPNIAQIMMPMGVLLGALLGMGSIANHSELIAIRSAGVSVNRLAGAVLATGVLLSLFTLVLSQYVGPPLDQFARQDRAVAKHGESSIGTGTSAWIRDGDTFLNVSGFSDDYQFGGIYMYRLGPGGLIEGIGRAESAGVDENDQWILNNFKETRFNGERVASDEATTMTRPNALNPDLIGLTVVKPSILSGVSLFRYIRYLKRNELDAKRYVVAFWSRIAAAVAVAPMCVLALPFVIGRMRTSGTGGRMAIGLVIGLAYFLAGQALADGSLVYDFNAVLVAWLPTLVLILVTMIALARVR